MKKSSAIALIPGAYLVITRYPGWKQVIGFLWLEILPLTCMLLFSVGLKACLFVFFHWLFLGLYEIGYWVNDRAGTSGERSGRPRLSLERSWLIAALISRLLALAAAIGLCTFLFDKTAALAYVCASVIVFMLLLLHTYVGELVSIAAKLRVVTFAGLAFGKYAPAALALAPAAIVAQALGWVFLAYGGGRVVEYAMTKMQTRTVDVPDVKALWYLAALMPAVILSGYSEYAHGVVACLSVFGAYYLLWSIKRSFRYFAGNR